MHFRIRRSVDYPVKHGIFIIGPNNEEKEANPGVGGYWDDAQLQVERQIQRNPLSFDQSTLFYMRWPKTEFLTDFVVEFIDLGCQYVFTASNGIGQWFYNPILDGGDVQENGLPAGVVPVRHKFFTELLVPVTAQMHNNLMGLLLAGSNLSEWEMCYQPKSHSHQFVNICLDFDHCVKEGHEQWSCRGFPGTGYTTYVVCGNARLIDFFDALCGSKSYKDEPCLTHILPGRTYRRTGDGSTSMSETQRMGTTYFYRKSRVEQVIVEDLCWRVHSDDTVWLMPSVEPHRSF